jgi:hypothetical protein
MTAHSAYSAPSATPNQNPTVVINLALDHFSRVVKNGSVVSILRVLTKRGGDDEKNAPDFAEATSDPAYKRASPKF